MFLNTSFPFVAAFRYQFLISIALGFFIGFLVIFLEPMGANNYSNPYKNIYFAGYGGIVSLSYLFFVSLSNVYMHFFSVWKWLEELIFSFLFISVAIIVTFFYTELCINKSTDGLQLDWFLWWYRNMFLSFGVLMGVLMIVLRRYYGIKSLTINEEVIEANKTQEKTVVNITGTVKKDFFKCAPTDILFVKSEDNYVYIYYITPEGVKDKMLRSTLKHIHEQLPDLLKVHRSCIVNHDHIRELKGNAQNAKLYMNNVDEPLTVSKTYYPELKSLVEP